jgi:DNA ligase 1
MANVTNSFISFPTLFKRTNAGAIQQWKIWIVGPTIFTEFGQVGGKLQNTSDTIHEGKNAGKVNSTTPETQALMEAQSKWERQKKKRYVESLEEAKVGAVDQEMVQGGIPPMLSINKSHPKDPILTKYLEYPCLVQPKLDGVRCIAIVEDGKASLWSRTQKPITSMPHIVEELESRFPNPGRIVLDGELYTHTYKDQFEDLISIIRKEEPDTEGLYKLVEYHIYDLPESNYGLDETSEFPYIVDHETSYKDRYNRYLSLINFGTNGTWNLQLEKQSVFALPAKLCLDEAQLLSNYETFLSDGYEGGMAKNLAAPYESGKRSYNILKMKEFQDSEFVIIGVNEGRGRDAGVAATFTCLTKEGKEFRARLKSTHKEKKVCWDNKDKCIGKLLTVTFKRYTSDAVPYIPVGKVIRDYE